MKAIVTGGCGFIGYNLVGDLLNKDWEVLVIDDFSSGKKWNTWTGGHYVAAAVESPFSLPHTADEEAIAEGMVIDHCVKEFEPDVIFHLAAVPRVSYSVEYPYETTQSNVLSTMAVLDAARKHGKPGIRIVNTSSSSIYGGADILPTSPSHPADPQSPYAMQKWQGEEWCRLYAKLYDLNVVSLRYFNVFGPHSYFGGAYSTVLSAWLYHLYVDPSYVPFLEDDGLQTRDFCFVDNVCQANMLAATFDQYKFSGDAFNIAQGKAHTLLDCKEILERISGKVLELEKRTRRVGDVRHTLADITPACWTLGYSPTTDFENQVKKMAEWYEHSYRKD